MKPSPEYLARFVFLGVNTRCPAPTGMRVCTPLFSPRDEVLDMIEDHVTNAVVEIPAAGESGRGALFRQVRKLPVPRYQQLFSIKSRNRQKIVVIRVKLNSDDDAVACDLAMSHADFFVKVCARIVDITCRRLAYHKDLYCRASCVTTFSATSRRNFWGMY